MKLPEIKDIGFFHEVVIKGTRSPYLPYKEYSDKEFTAYLFYTIAWLYKLKLKNEEPLGFPEIRLPEYISGDYVDIIEKIFSFAKEKDLKFSRVRIANHTQITKFGIKETTVAPLLAEKMLLSNWYSFEMIPLLRKSDVVKKPNAYELNTLRLVGSKMNDEDILFLLRYINLLDQNYTETNALWSRRYLADLIALMLGKVKDLKTFLTAVNEMRNKPLMLKSFEYLSRHKWTEPKVKELTKMISTEEKFKNFLNEVL